MSKQTTWTLFSTIAALALATSLGGCPGTTSAPSNPQASACYCFHWVHQAEHGAYCRTTLPECQALHESLDEHRDRTECRESQDDECASFACVDSGSECFSL